MDLDQNQNTASRPLGDMTDPRHEPGYRTPVEHSSAYGEKFFFLFSQLSLKGGAPSVEHSTSTLQIIGEREHVPLEGSRW